VDLCRSNALAAVERIQAAAEFLVEFRQLGCSGLIVLFEKPESRSDDLACRVITARIHLRVDEFLKLGSEGNVYSRASFRPSN
jgi:hypothetical protein